MKNLSLALILSLVAVDMTACKVGSTASTATATPTATPTSSPGTTSGNATPTPVPTATPPGMSCLTNWGGDPFPSGSVFYAQSLVGSTITSVQLPIYYTSTSTGQAMTGSTTYSTSMTLTAYTCGSSGSLGSQVATSTTNVGVNGNNTLVTFTFSPALAIPASGACSGSQNALSFVFSGTVATAGYRFSIGIVPEGTSGCFLNFSTSTSADVLGNFDLNGVISANP